MFIVLLLITFIIRLVSTVTVHLLRQFRRKTISRCYHHLWRLANQQWISNTPSLIIFRSDSNFGQAHRAPRSSLRKDAIFAEPISFTSIPPRPTLLKMTLFCDPQTLHWRTYFRSLTEFVQWVWHLYLNDNLCSSSRRGEKRNEQSSQGKKMGIYIFSISLPYNIYNIICAEHVIFSKVNKYFPFHVLWHICEM